MFIHRNWKRKENYFFSIPKVFFFYFPNSFQRKLNFETILKTRIVEKIPIPLPSRSFVVSEISISSRRKIGTLDSSTVSQLGIAIGDETFECIIGTVRSHHPFGGLVSISTHSFSKLCKSPSGKELSVPEKSANREQRIRKKFFSFSLLLNY